MLHVLLLFWFFMYDMNFMSCFLRLRDSGDMLSVIAFWGSATVLAIQIDYIYELKKFHCLWMIMSRRDIQI